MDGRYIVFKVRAKTLDFEQVRVIGDIQELGSWSVWKSIPFNREEVTQSGSTLWTCTVSVPLHVKFKYRYMICENCNTDISSGGERFVVKKWETMINPREFEGSDPDSGSCTAIIDDGEFGILADGTECTDKGWLTGTLSEVQFAIHDSFQYPITLFDADCESFRIRITPLHINTKKIVSDVLQDYNSVRLTILGSFDYEEHSTQDEKGHIYQPDNYFIFHTQTFSPETMSYAIDIFSDEDVPLLLGRGLILGNQFCHKSFTSLNVSLFKDHQPVGYISVSMLLVRSYAGLLSGNMEHNYATYWNNEKPAIDVGHRGMGASYCSENGALEEENTIASLSRAYDYGADFVEFDIVLTKDLVPILYHNSVIYTNVKRKNSSTTGSDMHDLHPTLIMDLTLEQHSNLKLTHMHEDTKGVINTEEIDQDCPMTMVFPTLEDAFDLTPTHLGFLIEIKYPVEEMDGPPEPYVDCNKCVDVILDVVAKKAGKRKVIFTCFHPSVCTMMRLKQPRYPVLLATSGVNGVYATYRNKVCQTLPIAVSFALSEKFLGISAFSTPLLKDFENIMSKIKRTKTVVFTWGAENNNEEIQQKQRNAGVKGVIFDRINDFNNLRQETPS